jgi:5S rRNA maturation endonuclease (ribonuclease M5)
MTAAAPAAIFGSAESHARAIRDRLTCGRAGCPCRRPGPVGLTHCPNHHDDRPSLSVSIRDPKVLIHCNAGCRQDVVLWTLQQHGLWPTSSRNGHDRTPASQGGNGGAAGRRIVATYDYTDATGAVLFQVVRFEPKDFRMRRPDGKGGWTWKLDGVTPVLYRLPEVMAAVRRGETVYIVEGEKDVEALRAAGAVATCNPGGAGKWRPEFTETLRGAHVAVVRDTDEPGRRHAAQVVASLRGVAASVRLVEAKAGKDAADHLAAGFGLDDFVDIPLPEPPDGADDVEFLKLLAEPGAGGAAGATSTAHDAPPDSIVSIADTGVSAITMNPPANGTFCFRRPAELLAAAPEQTPWVWHGHLARGALTVLGGREKSGKSTFVWGLIAALLSGRDFCGKPTTQTTVVVLTEESPATVAEKLERFGIAPDAPLSILTRSDVRGRPEWSAVVAAAGAEAARLGAGLVVIDTLSYWAALPPDAENSAGAMAEALRPLLELAGRGLAVLCLHHVNKAHGELRGSTAIGATADLIVTLTREPEAPSRRRLEVVGRFSDCPTEPVLIELNGNRYETLGSPREVSAEERERVVMGALPNEPPGRTQKELAEATGLPQPRVAEALGSLLSRGAVARTGQGTRAAPYRYHYTAAPPGAPAPPADTGFVGGDAAFVVIAEPSLTSDTDTNGTGPGAGAG